ncbi:MAG TPA: acyl-CoA dehydrogenase family protein [Gemmatimonadales bacterium]|nr:acyl-CoA dehydrogenase family protein [Gemmatimonadales bacterium]
MFGDDNELGIPALVAKLPGVLGAVQARAAVVAGELAKHATIWDDRECFPQSSMAALSEAGLLGLTVPKRFGGEGLGVAAACVALEELATGCLSSAMLAQLALNGPPRAIDVLGDEEQRARYLPGVAAGTRSFAIAITEPDAGSDALAMATRLEPDGRGFRLHGTKCYITNGANATNVLVFCRLAGTAGPRGIGAVVVDSEQAGFRPPSTQPKMGDGGSVRRVWRSTASGWSRAMCSSPPGPTRSTGPA